MVQVPSVVTQFAFFIDSDACSGCKTCQVACNDRNDLARGLHWRRVYEVTAGGWERRDGGWIPSVVAYNLSVACHHCLEPICAAVCSPGAVVKREDGVVLIDESRCNRCQSCRVSCPYGAIRLDPVYGVSKCDFCADELTAGRPPACVAACPNRALDFGDLEKLRKEHGTVGQVFPLPSAVANKPALVIKPHRNLAGLGVRIPEIANSEEL